MKIAPRSTWLATVLLAGLMINASAETPEGMTAGEAGIAEQPAVEEGKKGEARFAFGLTYAAGMVDVDDYITELYEANGIDYDSLVIPVGPSFVGGYRFGFGLELLGDVGPISFLIVDDTEADDIFMNIDIPVGLTVGYAFMTEKSVSPYLRGGFRHHFSSGDFTESSEPGLYVAGGINFFSNKAVQLQVEVAYDGSTVTYRSPEYYEGFPYNFYSEKEIEPGGLLISVRAAF